MLPSYVHCAQLMLEIEKKIKLKYLNEVADVPNSINAFSPHRLHPIDKTQRNHIRTLELEHTFGRRHFTVDEQRKRIYA